MGPFTRRWLFRNYFCWSRSLYTKTMKYKRNYLDNSKWSSIQHFEMSKKREISTTKRESFRQNVGPLWTPNGPIFLPLAYWTSINHPQSQMFWQSSNVRWIKRSFIFFLFDVPFSKKCSFLEFTISKNSKSRVGVNLKSPMLREFSICFYLCS